MEILTFLTSLISASISGFVLWKLQAKKREDDTDLRAFGYGLDRKLKEFESTLAEKNAYLTERGKGTATKEDIEEITRKVEAIKTEFLTSAEFLRAELSKKGNLHKLQAEKEFEVYSVIWEKIINLRYVTENLRPAFDSYTPNENLGEKWNNRYKEVREAHIDLMKVVEKQRPFYPHSLYLQLHVIIAEVWDELLDFELSFKEDREWKMSLEGYKRGRENIRKLLQSIDVVCDLMRNRISET